MIQQKDIAIVGGGLIGSVVAIALRHSGFKIAVLDQVNLQSILNAAYDGRTLAIAYGSKLLLEKWGIWQEIQDLSQPIQEIRVSSPAPASFVHYDAQEVARHPMGYIVEIRHLRRALFQMLLGSSSIELLAPAQLEKFTPDKENVKLTLSGHPALAARLLIGADGRQSVVREALGIKPRQWSYDQTAIVCVIQHEKPHAGAAFEHFLASGPLALLPMSGKKSSLVWTLSTARAQAYLRLNEVDFIVELQRNFGYALGAMAVEGSRWSYPLNGLYSREWYKGRVVLVGDACHAIHPVAGQGFNLGLRSAAVLVEKLATVKDIGNQATVEQALKSYQRSRRFDTLSMTAMTDGLVRLFSNDRPSLQLLRNAGLRMTNRMPLIKRLLTKHAMGLSYR